MEDHAKLLLCQPVIFHHIPLIMPHLHNNS